MPITRIWTSVRRLRRARWLALFEKFMFRWSLAIVLAAGLATAGAGSVTVGSAQRSVPTGGVELDAASRTNADVQQAIKSFE